jgi:hypothetical protein
MARFGRLETVDFPELSMEETDSSHAFSSSTSTTYTTDDSGNPVMIEKSTTKRKGPGGVRIIFNLAT